MRSLIESVLKPILVAVLAIVTSCLNDGCIPPGGQALEDAYKAEIRTCVETMPTIQASCFCRKAVDTKYGLCAQPEWPRVGRCEAMCEGL